MPNLIPQDIAEWMRRVEFKLNDITRRMSSLIPGDIADAVDLDGYMSSGRWRRRSTTSTTTALHYPFDGAAGTLEVYWDPEFTHVQQVFYDRTTGTWSRWYNGTTWSAWQSDSDHGLPDIASTTVAAQQTVVAVTTPANLPTSAAATLSIPPGTHIVQASVSCLVGAGTSNTATSTTSVKYWLSGALVFQPALTDAGVGGANTPIANGGGTYWRNHQVTVTAATNLTITAKAALHFGTGVDVRDVTVQLVIVRRNA